MNKHTVRVLAERVKSALEREAKFLDQHPTGHWWDRSTFAHLVDLSAVKAGLRRIAKTAGYIVHITQPVRKRSKPT